jgi:hypothetical protein
LASRSRGAIDEEGGDRLEAAWISEPSKHEGRIAAQVPVVMGQPRLEYGDGSAIGGSSQCPADLELPPEPLLVLEVFKQLSGRKGLHFRVRRNDVQPALLTCAIRSGASPSQ